MTTPAMTPTQLTLLLAAAHTFAARHPDANPETTYHRHDDAARLRCTGKRALARADNDPVLPDGGEALMTAITRSTLTRQEPPMPTPTPAITDQLTKTSDDDLTHLITNLAEYLHHRTTAHLHHTRGLKNSAASHDSDAARHLMHASHLLSNITKSDRS